MATGFYFGNIFFLVLPLLAFFILGFDLSKYPEAFFQSSNIDIDFAAIYSILTVLVVFLFSLRFIKKDASLFDGVVDSIFNWRLQRVWVFVSFFSLVYLVYEGFSLDHAQHWLERGRDELFSSVWALYFFPFVQIGLLISVAGVAAFVVLLFGLSESRGKLNKNLIFFFVFDLVLVFLAVFNSGNRWYLALLGILIYVFSSKKYKLFLILFFPLVVFFGGFISKYILAWRVGIDFSQYMNLFFGSDFGELFANMLIEITEGFNLATLFSLAKISLDSPDPIYILMRVFLLPLPGSLVEKFDPFNIHVAEILTGVKSNLSLNSTVIGAFVYSFGYFSLPLILIFGWGLHRLDRLGRASCVNVVYFSIFFSGFRFGFEYLLMAVIYLNFILLAGRVSLTERVSFRR